MIDRNALEDIACSVETHEILRGICIPEARAKHPDGRAIDYLTELPKLTDPLEVRAAWWAQRGIERHPDEFYPIYHAVARLVKPRRIAEIGVWWGYALMAMVTGTLAAGTPNDNITVAGYDNESYPGAEHCLDWATKAFGDIGVNAAMIHCDSRQFDGKGLPVENIDLFSVDGDHTYESALKDLILAHNAMSTNPEAAIIVDDVGWALNVRQAVEEFCETFHWRPMWLPTLKGSAVLQRL